jgi:hypothetical protein
MHNLKVAMKKDEMHHPSGIRTTCDSTLLLLLLHNTQLQAQSQSSLFTSPISPITVSPSSISGSSLIMYIYIMKHLYPLRISETTSIEDILKIMQTHSNNVDVQKVACAVLNSLSYNDDDNRKKIALLA